MGVINTSNDPWCHNGSTGRFGAGVVGCIFHDHELTCFAEANGWFVWQVSQGT